jgi:uncharacterized phage protein gp47/JayE
MTFPSDIDVNQNSDIILARMKANDAMTGIDTSVNSPMNMALAPVSIELAEAYRQLEAMLYRNRLVGDEGEVATGDDLDAVGDERGIYRLPGATATGIVRFIGPNGTVIPINTVVTTLGPNVRRYTTDHAAVIDVTGQIDVAATALEVGTASNVPANAIQLLEVPISQTRVTNLAPFTGGVDVEDDDAYRARVVEFVRDPPNGSNPAQYRKWARDIPGIGGAVTLRPGETDAGPPGTVDLYVVDTLMLPASQDLVDEVQDYIAPSRETTFENEAMTISNPAGVTGGVTGIAGAVGTVIRMAYNASADGLVTHTPSAAQLVQGGNWQARVRAEVTDTTNRGVLLTLTAFNTTVGQIAQASADLALGTATVSFRADQMALDWAYYALPFYWNGSDSIVIRVYRMRTDNTSQLLVDSLTYHSLFSNYDREGLAPILDEVRVKPALGRPIDVTASIHLEPGYSWSGGGGVGVAVTSALNDYLRGIALVNVVGGSGVANDVIYGEIGATIQGVTGVDYYDPATLRVNGATLNVAVAKREVAVPGSYTFTII